MLSSSIPGRPLTGRISIPPDKSISHRALIFGALAEGPLEVFNLLRSEDVLSTWHCLEALGVRIEDRRDSILVHGRGFSGLQPPSGPLDCGNSGTTARLLSGVLAGRPFESVLTGDASLSRRPMARVAVPLRLMGADIWSENEEKETLPLHIQGRPLQGITYQLPVASAQVKSALLFAGLQAANGIRLREPSPSRDHTERLLDYLAAPVRWDDGWMILDGLTLLHPCPITVPGDISSAAFFIAGATIVPGSDLTLSGVNVNPARIGLLEVLREMGGEVEMLDERLECNEPLADLRVKASSLRGVTVGGDQIPRLIDEVPLLAVLGSQAEGDTIVKDALELRVKESDRIKTIVTELRHLGADIEERPDGFAVHGPVRLQGARCESHGDHRIAMSLAIAGLVADGETVVSGAEAVAISFPNFAELLASLTE